MSVQLHVQEGEAAHIHAIHTLWPRVPALGSLAWVYVDAGHPACQWAPQLLVRELLSISLCGWFIPHRVSGAKPLR